MERLDSNAQAAHVWPSNNPSWTFETIHATFPIAQVLPAVPALMASRTGCTHFSLMAFDKALSVAVFVKISTHDARSVVSAVLISEFLLVLAALTLSAVTHCIS